MGFDTLHFVELLNEVFQQRHRPLCVSLWSRKEFALFPGLLQTSIHKPWESGGHQDRVGEMVLVSLEDS